MPIFPALEPPICLPYGHISPLLSLSCLLSHCRLASRDESRDAHYYHRRCRAEHAPFSPTRFRQQDVAIFPHASTPRHHLKPARCRLSINTQRDRNAATFICSSRAMSPIVSAPSSELHAHWSPIAISPNGRQFPARHIRPKPCQRRQAHGLLYAGFSIRLLEQK